MVDTADEKKDVVYDVDGYDVITTAIRELVNQYPGLVTGDEVTFSTLSEDSGKALFPVSGAVIETEKTSVTGKVLQVCAYPFYVVYRAAGLSENRKAGVKEWLDNLGRWLEQQTVTINGMAYKLAELPALTDGRKLRRFQRRTPAHLDSIEANNAENWAIYLTAQYQNEFYRKKG